MKSLELHGRAVAAALAFTALTAASASANCISTKSADPAAYRLAVQSYQRMKANLQHLGATRPADATSNASIVGLWHTVILADPDGGYSTAGPNVIDEGFDIWSSDGTETLNDISAPPTGNVCLGAWTQTGPLTYTLKHPTWIFDPTNTFVIGVGTIGEVVTLDASGKNFSGTTTFDILDLSGTNIFHSVSSVIAERIVADGQLFQPTPGPAAGISAKVTASATTTSDASVTLDGSASTGIGALTYFYSVVAGGKVPALLQSPGNPKATVDFVNGPGNYIVQLTVTDSAGHTATSDPVTLIYQGK